MRPFRGCFSKAAVGLVLFACSANYYTSAEANNVVDDLSENTPSNVWNEKGRHVFQKFLTHLGEREFSGSRELVAPNPRHLEASCGDILDNYTAAELRDVLLESSEFILSGNDLALFKFFVLPKVFYGISVRKICAACTDFPGLCGSDDYGANVTHSGLVMFPLADEGNHVPGTHVGSIFCHGTEASNQDAPSVQWLGVDAQGRLTTIAGAFFAGLTASTAIFPDYTGYVDSAYPKSYRSYLIKKSYATGSLPLWYRAQELIRKETDCKAAIADAVVVTGYSEGGFAAVAVAQALHERGDTEIVHVFAGGAPFRLSSAQIRFSFEQLRSNTFPAASNYYLAVLGSSFSSTNPDLPNYEQGQDWFSASVRQGLIDVVNGGQGQTAINNAINSSNPLDTINQDLFQVVEAALDRGELEPCVSSVVPGESDLICQALQEQDLAEYLETAVQFPVTICHSVDDLLVSPDNRPNISLNMDYLSLTEITGGVGHSTAAGRCILDVISWYLVTENVIEYPVALKHAASCSSPSSAPNSISATNPMGAPTEAPTKETSGSSYHKRQHLICLAVILFFSFVAVV